RRRIPARAPRRMPLKRCRIIDIGGPIATPTGATRAWLQSVPLATPRGRRDPRESICADVAIELRGPTRWRSARVEYLVRTARITDIDRLVALSDGVVP